MRIPAYGLLDLETGVLETLAPTKGEPADAVLWGAAFSPDGSRLLLTYSDSSLAVRYLAGSPVTALDELDAPLGEGITWAANGLVFGRSGGGMGLLIQLTDG